MWGTTAARFLAIQLNTAILLASGLRMLLRPQEFSDTILSSRLPDFVQHQFGSLEPPLWSLLTALFGSLLLFSWAMLYLDVMRPLVAGATAITLLVGAVAYHVSFDNPEAMTNERMLDFLTDISVSGGLLVIAAAAAVD